MVEKLHGTGIGKGLIGGNFCFFPRWHRQTLLAIFGSSTSSFAPIWAWGYSKSNFKQIRFFLPLLAVGGGSNIAAGGGRLSFRRLVLLLRRGDMMARGRVRVWCEVEYLYLFSFNVSRPSHLIWTVRSRLNRKWIWTVHRDLICTVRSRLNKKWIWTIHRDLIWTVWSCLKKKQIRTVHTRENKFGSSDRGHADC